ncbi:hypothetical protein H0W91_00130 [Patescibacteria group bacterium]|nr:hypothetical protein [Patescibacteria group bacterium]
MSNATEQNNNLKDLVLRKIESGELSMKPKYYFVLKVSLLIFIAFVTFMLSALLVSYILFSLREGGQFFLIGFGTRGLYEFFMVFPWLLLGLDILLLLFLDWLLKSFRFGYNSPIIYLFSGSLLLITVLGSLINFTSFHDNMMRRAEGKNLPFAGGLYDGLRKSHDGLFLGTIVAIEGNEFMITNSDNDPRFSETIKVIATINADIQNRFSLGDKVFIAGDVVNGAIHAYGVHAVTP